MINGSINHNPHLHMHPDLERPDDLDAAFKIRSLRHAAGKESCNSYAFAFA
jgi:hypothetical protein